MKTRKGDFNEDGTRAIKPVAVEAVIVPEPPEPEVSPDSELEDLLSLTRDELLDVADEEGVEVPSKATKSDIIAAIQGVVE